MHKDYIYSTILHIVLFILIATFGLLFSSNKIPASSINVSLISNNMLESKKSYKELNISNKDKVKPLQEPNVTKPSKLKEDNNSQNILKSNDDNNLNNKNFNIDDNQKSTSEITNIKEKLLKEDKVQETLKKSLEKKIAEAIEKELLMEKQEKQVGEKKDFLNEILKGLEKNSLKEEDIRALNQQIKGCWYGQNIHSEKEDLKVELLLTMNKDATINNIKILNEGGFKNAEVRQVVKEQVLRALKDPKCSPLRLPKGGYENWKIIHMIFDPRG